MLAIFSIISLITVILLGIFTSISIPLLLLIFFAIILGLILLNFALVLLGWFIDPDDLPEKVTGFHRFVTLSVISLILSGVRAFVTVRGKELIPDQPFVYISNHFSVFDPMIAMLYLRKHKLAFVSKKENIQIPLAGRFMLASGCVSLDRSSNRGAAKVISDAAENVISGRCSMGIYPEGGSNRDPENVPLKPFHSGSFKVATKAKAPIVVAVISNTRKITKRLFTHVTLDIIKVIPYEEYKELKTSELSELVHNIMIDWIVKA